MKKHRESGVTLIEILIAVSLLSLLSVGMLVAMRLGFSTMDKADARLVQNRRVSNSRAIIENEIDGFMFSLANYRPQPNQVNPVLFLEAEPQSMRFVTAYSIDDAWRGLPRIAVLQVIPGENNQGVRLIVNETPYTGPEQTGQEITGLEQQPGAPPLVHFAPVPPGSASFVLADRLAYCRFSYLELYRDPAAPAPSRRWFPTWRQSGLLPLAIRIEMAPLDPEPTTLQVSTV
ncbi:MAG TPA: prepilin-type N-terminal cleavage/methylation domain-containing protein, partial [Bryobacteraceae bacterium]|nr:prepilin-type N-terminal cleavage/methylation domain-containing protein [Bryobacteraceae bacterium]